MSESFNVKTDTTVINIVSSVSSTPIFNASSIQNKPISNDTASPTLGSVLLFNGTEWVASTELSSSSITNSSEDAFIDTEKGVSGALIGVNTPQGYFLSSTDVINDPLNAQTPLSGYYFDTQKSAIRSGHSDSLKFDRATMGSYSFSSGNDCVAEGESSVSLGQDCYSSASFGISQGKNAYSFNKGYKSFSSGNRNGDYSSGDGQLISFTAWNTPDIIYDTYNRFLIDGTERAIIPFPVNCVGTVYMSSTTGTLFNAQKYDLFINGNSNVAAYVATLNRTWNSGDMLDIKLIVDEDPTAPDFLIESPTEPLANIKSTIYVEFICTKA